MKNKKPKKKSVNPMTDDFLDFDDISGKKKSETPVVSAPPTPEVKEQKKDNYYLLYTVGKSSFKEIGLNECSSEDFVNFVNYIYPVPENDHKVYARRDVRIRALKNIIKWNTQSLQWLRSQKRKPKEAKPN
jgi:hypothetical protein